MAGFPSPLSDAYDAKAVESAAQELWEKERCHAFDAAEAERHPERVWSVDTPPPTVSGSLHIGHVFSYTQAECVVRYKRMRGWNVFYPFGFDGNGLPTERLAEDRHKVRGKDMPRPDFVRLCLETSHHYEKEFEAYMRSLGVSADWSLAYSTIDDRCVRISQRAFVDLWKRGEVYLKESPTLWCTTCGTALAQADLEFKDRPSRFTTLRFDLAGGGALRIATTRPELLPACVAVFVHPAHPQAQAILGRRAVVPLQDRDVPILADDKVDPEKGTGIVMCCTFGDKTDVEWFQKHRLPLRQAIDATGRMMPIAGAEAGLAVGKARKAILERLATAGHAEEGKDIVHPVATHERCGTDIQFLPTRQVFVRILDKKADLIAASEKIRWLPDYMGKRFRNWVENLEWDWCLSRQRFYGVPFPIWHCKACGTISVARDEDLPVDPTAASPKAPCSACGGSDFEPERDVMDTWATSSETPQINARWGDPAGPPRATRPMALRPQAHEIIRTWAFYTVAKSWMHFRDVPWKDAMISGLVLGKDGEKISKSRGNAPDDPKTLLARHGADALRYWALSARLGTDYPYSDTDLASGRRLCVKLWNAARLVLPHLTGFDPAAPRAPERPVDRGIRLRLAQTVSDVTRLLDDYEFGLAKKRVEEFFWGDLCDNWLEMAKGRLYDAAPEHAAERRAAQATAYDALWGVLRLLAPFVPHVVEAVHQAHFRATEGVASVTRAAWPGGEVPITVDPNDPGIAAWSAALPALMRIRQWRSENKVSPGKPIPAVRFTTREGGVAPLREVTPDVIAGARVGRIEVVPGDVPADEDPRFEVLEPPPA